MKVTLEAPWFAPSAVRVGTDKIFKISGQSFARGTHDMPEVLRPYLPRSAKVHEGADTNEPAVDDGPEAEDENTLRSFDAERAAAEATGDVLAKAQQFKEELDAEQREKEFSERQAARKAKNKARMAEVRAAKLTRAG